MREPRTPPVGAPKPLFTPQTNRRSKLERKKNQH